MRIINKAASAISAFLASCHLYLRAFWLNPRRLVFFAFALLALASTAAGGLVVGVLAERRHVPLKLDQRAKRLYERYAGRWSDIQVGHTHKQSAYHELEVDRIPLGRAWAIEEVGKHLVFSSRHGQISYLTPAQGSYHAASLGIATPMNMDALRQSEIGRNEAFGIMEFRTTDLLSLKTGPAAYDLYAVHQRFEGDCFRLVVSRIGLKATDESLAAEGAEWKQIFQSRDCVRPKAQGAYYVGEQSGGRLVRLDDHRLALSIGDFQFDGVYADKAVSMDPASDLGKIIEISLDTGQSRILAMGLRNPQGLLETHSGQLWETEHGPQGGDEVNLIRDGANYGWPVETYGMKYGGKPEDWPGAADPANQANYERPRFSFTPSIGISNLVEPDTREFPRWGHHLLVASLRGGTLELLRLDGDSVASSEPIGFDNQRIRDILSLNDGRIAFATDDGDIDILSNSDRAKAGSGPALLSGLKELGPQLPTEMGPTSIGGAPIFGEHCAHCHSVVGQTIAGPPLDGLLGRRVGGVEGYAYSKGLTGRTETWTDGRLREFLVNPEGVYPGTAMPYPNVPDEEMDQVIEFIESRKAAKPPASSPRNRGA